MPKPVGSVGLFEVDEQWDEVQTQKVGRGSPLDTMLREIKNAPQVHGKTIGLVKYETQQLARGMYNSLKTRIGPPEASGFTFQVRTNGSGYAVVAIYDGSKVTEAGKVQFAREDEARKAKAREANEKAKAEKAKAKKATEAATGNGQTTVSQPKAELQSVE